MNEPNSVARQIYPLIRRRLFPLWLASAWPYALEAGCMISIAIAIHWTGPMGSPADRWHSMSGLIKTGIILAFVAGIFLPLDLGAAGVAMIVKSDRQGEGLDLNSFVSRLASIVWLAVPLSISIGAASIFMTGLFLVPWSSFVMPALATAQANPRTAVRRSLGFSLRRFAPLLGLALATGVAQSSAFLAFFVCRMAAGDGEWRVGIIVGWSLFAAMMSIVAMTRSVTLALLYLDAVRSEEVLRAPQLI